MIAYLIRLAFLAFVLATAASAFGRFWWGFELITHFRPHLAAAGIAFALFFAVRWQPGWAVGAALLVAVHAAPLLPYVAPGAAHAAGGEGRRLRVLALNLHHRHADMEAVLRVIREEQPDMVLLTELAAGHPPILAALDGLLPYKVDARARGSGDLLLLSRWPVAAWAIRGPSPASRPILEARLCAPDDAGQCITLVGLHAPVPILNGAPWRAAVFERAAARAAAAGGRVVLLGDLNCTPWSPAFADLLARGGLSDAARGLGLAATWASRFPLIGLPIDHVLIGKDITALSRRVGADVGSDHLPVIVDLSLRER